MKRIFNSKILMNSHKKLLMEPKSMSKLYLMEKKINKNKQKLNQVKQGNQVLNYQLAHKNIRNKKFSIPILYYIIHNLKTKPIL